MFRRLTVLRKPSPNTATGQPARRAFNLFLSPYLGAAVAILILMAAGIHFARRSGTDYHQYTNDFNVYYFAATEIISGHDPYQHRLGPSTPYLYPPLLAEALVPLAVLPLQVGAYLWYVVSATALILCAGMSAHLALAAPDAESVPGARAGATCSLDMAGPGYRSRYRWVALLSVLVVGRFALDSFDMGQVNSVVAALAVGHVYLFRKKRAVASAVTIALAVAIKLSPAIILGYHVAKGRFKFAGQCAVLTGAVCLASFLPSGSHSVSAFNAFWSQTVRNGQGFDLAYSGNQSIRGAIARLEGEAATLPARRTTEPSSVLVGIALVSMALVAAMKARTEAGAAAPFLCLAPLLSPLTWKGHYIILLMPVAVLMAAAFTDSSKTRRTVAAVLAFLPGVIFDATSPKIAGVAFAERADSYSLILLAALLVFAGVVWLPGARPGTTSRSN